LCKMQQSFHVPSCYIATRPQAAHQSIQHSAAQRSTAQHSTAQHSTVQHTTSQPAQDSRTQQSLQQCHMHSAAHHGLMRQLTQLQVACLHQPGEVLIQHCFHAIPAVCQLHLSLLASALNSLLLLCTLLLVALLVVKHLAITLVSYGADAQDHGPAGGLVLL